MFPSTKADRLPNIGRTVAPGVMWYYGFEELPRIYVRSRNLHTNRLGERGLIVQGFTISPAVEPNTNIAEEGTFKRGLGTPSG